MVSRNTLLRIMDNCYGLSFHKREPSTGFNLGYIGSQNTENVKHDTYYLEKSHDYYVTVDPSYEFPNLAFDPLIQRTAVYIVEIMFTSCTGFIVEHDDGGWKLPEYSFNPFSGYDFKPDFFLDAQFDLGMSVHARERLCNKHKIPETLCAFGEREHVSFYYDPVRDTRYFSDSRRKKSRVDVYLSTVYPRRNSVSSDLQIPDGYSIAILKRIDSDVTGTTSLYTTIGSRAVCSRDFFLDHYGIAVRHIAKTTPLRPTGVLL